MSVIVFCTDCANSFANEDSGLCTRCENEFNKAVKAYLKKNLEVHVALDNGQSLGYIEVKVKIVLDGEEIDSGHDSTWLHVTE